MSRAMAESVYRVIGRFADRELAIRQLHRDDPDFRELCDDYRDVLDALERARSDSDRRELARLQVDLEEEIVAKLSRDCPME